MKQIRFFCIILILVVFCGCSAKTGSNAAEGFYYPTSKLTAQAENPCLKLELRQVASVRDIGLLVNEYLSGPTDAELYCPFSKEIKLRRWTLSNSDLELVFTDSMSHMQSRDITLACSALSATIFALTDVKQISICCETAPLNGCDQLLLTPEQITWVDIVTNDIITESEVQK